MNQLDWTFIDLKKKKQKALVAYLAAGYPAFAEQKKLIKGMVKAGVDVLELGIPFSDPIADGPTIQYASQQALLNGVTLKKIFAFVKELKKEVNIPVILMGYMNSIHAMGVDHFTANAKDAGVDGVIVPDLIIEEGRGLELIFHRNNIHMIYLAAPTSSLERQKMIAARTSGFLYAVSVTGVTGARKDVKKMSGSWIANLRKFTTAPVCVGFGISKPSDIRSFKKDVDGVIVGSALIDVVRRSSKAGRQKAVEKFIRGLAKECHHAG